VLLTTRNIAVIRLVQTDMSTIAQTAYFERKRERQMGK